MKMKIIRSLVRQELRKGRADTVQEAHENAEKRLEAMEKLTDQAQKLNIGYN